MSSSELGPNLAEDVEMENPEDEAMDIDNTDKDKHIATSLEHITRMPPTIKAKIFDMLDAYSHRSARLVCHDFKQESDDVTKYYEQIKFEVKRKGAKQNEYIRISLEVKKNKWLRMEFHDHPEGYLMRNYAQKWKKLVKGDDNYSLGAAKYFVKVAYEDVVYIAEYYFDLLPISLRHARDFTEEMLDDLDDLQARVLNDFSDVCKELDSYFDPRKFTINFNLDQDYLKNLLEMMEGEKLESLILRRDGFAEHSFIQEFEMNEIVEMEQWRGLREFRSDNEHDDLKIDDCQHLQEFKIDFGPRSVEAFKEIFMSCINHEGPGSWSIVLQSSNKEVKLETCEESYRSCIPNYDDKLAAVHEMIGQRTDYGDYGDLWELQQPPRTSVKFIKVDATFIITKE